MGSNTKRLRLTTISENTATNGCIGEWGLSVLVETDEITLLFDAGQHISAAYNAGILGVNLKNIDRIVLSHGHFDHTGGLKEILQRSGSVEIIGHPDIWDAKYRCLPEQKKHYIGIPFLQTDLESIGASFLLSRTPVHITDDIMTTGEIPMINNFEKHDRMLCVEKNGTLYPDEIMDDLSLIIRTDYGLVVILGCAHRGVINILKHARKITGVDEINAVVGGLHLFRSSEEEVDQTISALSEFNIKLLGASHCTGFAASVELAQQFPETFIMNNAGTIIDLPAAA